MGSVQPAPPVAMEFTSTNVLTIVIALLATAVVWGGMQWRVGRLEKDIEILKAGFEKDVSTLASTVETKISEYQRARELQGERIGATEGDIRALFERSGLPADGGTRRRRLTKPGGEKA